MDNESFERLSEIMFGKDERPYNRTNGIIKTWRDPYRAGYSTTYAREVKFEPGVTVLVGCNGCGKTTLIRNIKSNLGNNHVAYLDFDNLSDGGSNSLSSLAFHGDTDNFMAMWGSSEGERIVQNIGIFAERIGKRISNKFKDASEMWIMLDASDSGLSIDNVIELKQFFSMLLNDVADKDIYIIVAANEYEMAAEQKCLDVMSGKYVDLKSYDDYKKFILKSRERKEKRMKSAEEKAKRG